MIAEINGKISSSGSNLTERLEDKLTGDFFGTIRYLPFDKGLKPVLEKTCFSRPENKKHFINILKNVNHPCYTFWPKHKEAELDVSLGFEDTIIGIEIKYFSSLSSKDDGKKPDISRHQLSRESRVVKSYGKSKNVLILIAPRQVAEEIYSSAIKYISNDILFGHLSWEDIYNVIEGLNKKDCCSSFPYSIILSDILKLLKRKGFERFKSFENLHLEKNITLEGFSYNKKYEVFSFALKDQITNKYYEYR